jgi:hypothetical protein
MLAREAQGPGSCAWFLGNRILGDHRMLGHSERDQGNRMMDKSGSFWMSFRFWERFWLRRGENTTGAAQKLAWRA